MRLRRQLQTARRPESHPPTLPIAPAGSEQPLQIALADDDAVFRRYLSICLGEAGHRVLEARDGAELLRLLGDPAVGIDVVVTDYRMPGMDGAALLESLHAAWTPLATIVMSAFADPALVQRAGELGIPVVSKPFPITRLLKAIAFAATASTPPHRRNLSTAP
jgi:CheY-like chemotaxis protein